MPVLTDFAGQNWLVTPAALAVGEISPASIYDQKFLLTLSGVVMANLEGNSVSQWLYETLSFLPDMAGPQGSGPLNWAIARFGIPKPTDPNFKIGFSLEEWAPFASLSSIFDQDQSINAGFAVDVWRPTHFATGTDAFTHLPVGNIFTGIDVDVAVRDTDAWIFRLGYNITLLGKIVFLSIPETLFSSDFDPTPDGDPPSAVQAVGTASVDAPAGSVIVVDPPIVHSDKWIQISRPPNTPDLANFVGVLTEVRGDGVYNFSAFMFVPINKNDLEAVASISFETAAQPFLHLDFMSDSTLRIDDTTELGSFPRTQPFIVQVTLNVSAAQTTARVVLLGGGASLDQTYTIPAENQPFSRQFAQLRVWQGFGDFGVFYASNIVVSVEG
jgi:hypothetical protein